MERPKREVTVNNLLEHSIKIHLLERNTEDRLEVNPYELETKSSAKFLIECQENNKARLSCFLGDYQPSAFIFNLTPQQTNITFEKHPKKDKIIIKDKKKQFAQAAILQNNLSASRLKIGTSK